MNEKSSTNLKDQFLDSAKILTNYESLVDLIRKAIESPFVYSFSELLEIPLINSVKKLNINK